MAKKVNIQTSNTTSNATTQLNYNGEPLKPGQVLVPMNLDELFIKENVTNPKSIITLTVADYHFKAVLVAVDKKDEKKARAQFNYWQNDILGNYGHRMDEESIEDRAERELPEHGFSPSASDCADEVFLLLDMMKVLIDKAPQIAYGALLNLYGVDDMEEFQDKMKLKNNGAYKALRLAKATITDMLTKGIDKVEVNYTTKKDDYYRKEAQILLKLILELRYK